VNREAEQPTPPGVGCGAWLDHTALTPDQIGELLTRQELAVLDDDLSAPWANTPWQRVHSDKLVKIQLCRLLRELISVTKQRNDRNNS
jgi:hypothetical protein